MKTKQWKKAAALMSAGALTASIFFFFKQKTAYEIGTYRKNQGAF